MPEDTNDDLPDDQDDTSGDGTDDGGEQQGVTLEQLQAKIDSLEATNTKTSRDLIAAVGRLQALQSKVEAGTGDSDTVTALKTQMAAADEILNALLEDEAVDPKVKERAQGARTKAQSKTELDALRREIEELKKPRTQQAAPDTDNAPSPFERGIVLAIQAAGLSPDDPIFDWKGEASAIFHQKGQDAATEYFRKQIEAGLAEKATASRRQNRKDAGATQSGKPGGDALKPLDPSRSIEDRLKHLKEIGAI